MLVGGLFGRTLLATGRTGRLLVGRMAPTIAALPDLLLTLCFLSHVLAPYRGIIGMGCTPIPPIGGATGPLGLAGAAFFLVFLGAAALAGAFGAGFPGTAPVIGANPAII